MAHSPYFSYHWESPKVVELCDFSITEHENHLYGNFSYISESQPVFYMSNLRGLAWKSNDGTRREIIFFLEIHSASEYIDIPVSSDVTEEILVFLLLNENQNWGLKELQIIQKTPSDKIRTFIQSFKNLIG